MKDITNKSIEKDLKLVEKLLKKYSDAVWEGQEGQPAHYDNQDKLVRIGISNVRTGLHVAIQSLIMLNDVGVKED